MASRPTPAHADPAPSAVARISRPRAGRASAANRRSSLMPPPPPAPARPPGRRARPVRAGARRRAPCGPRTGGGPRRSPGLGGPVQAAVGSYSAAAARRGTTRGRGRPVPLARGQAGAALAQRGAGSVRKPGTPGPPDRRTRRAPLGGVAAGRPRRTFRRRVREEVAAAAARGRGRVRHAPRPARRRPPRRRGPPRRSAARAPPGRDRAVDFPPPLGPTRAMTSPGRTSQDTAIDHGLHAPGVRDPQAPDRTGAPDRRLRRPRSPVRPDRRPAPRSSRSAAVPRRGVVAPARPGAPAGTPRACGRHDQAGPKPTSPPSSRRPTDTATTATESVESSSSTSEDRNETRSAPTSRVAPIGHRGDSPPLRVRAAEHLQRRQAGDDVEEVARAGERVPAAGPPRACAYRPHQRDEQRDERARVTTRSAADTQSTPTSAITTATGTTAARAAADSGRSRRPARRSPASRASPARRCAAAEPARARRARSPARRSCVLTPAEQRAATVSVSHAAAARSTTTPSSAASAPRGTASSATARAIAS